MNSSAYDKPSRGETSASITVVIPHLSGKEHTEACCSSLTNQTIMPARVLVVNNGSSDVPDASSFKEFPLYKIIHLPENRGFAAAANTGIRQALKDPATTHCLILNNDTVCPPDTLEKLLLAIESATDNGLAGCPMVEGQEAINEKVVAAGNNLLWPWMIPIACRPDRTPDYIAGTCLLLKRRTIEETGLFDEGFFFFFEDADFNVRAKKAGWRLAVAQDACIKHLGSVTASQFPELLNRNYRFGHIRLLRKYARHPYLLGLPPALIRLLIDLLKLNWSVARGNIQGVFRAMRAPAPKHQPS